MRSSETNLLQGLVCVGCVANVDLCICIAAVRSSNFAWLPKWPFFRAGMKIQFPSVNAKGANLKV